MSKTPQKSSINPGLTNIHPKIRLAVPQKMLLGKNCISLQNQLDKCSNILRKTSLELNAEALISHNKCLNSIIVSTEDTMKSFNIISPPSTATGGICIDIGVLEEEENILSQKSDHIE